MNVNADPEAGIKIGLKMVDRAYQFPSQGAKTRLRLAIIMNGAPLEIVNGVTLELVNVNGVTLEIMNGVCPGIEPDPLHPVHGFPVLILITLHDFLRSEDIADFDLIKFE